MGHRIRQERVASVEALAREFNAAYSTYINASVNLEAMATEAAHLLGNVRPSREEEAEQYDRERPEWVRWAESTTRMQSACRALATLLEVS